MRSIKNFPIVLNTFVDIYIDNILRACEIVKLKQNEEIFNILGNIYHE